MMEDIRKRIAEIRKKLMLDEISTKDALLALIEAVLDTDIHPFAEDTKKDILAKLDRALPFKKHADTLLALCYYHVLERGEDPTTKDINNLLYQLRLPRPKNPTDILKKIASRESGRYLQQYTAKSGDKGAKVTRWRITREGIKYVESLIEGE